jgi:O-antigen/teichoic acid export membrane protein
MQKHRSRRLIAKNSIFNLAGQVLPMLVGILTIPYIVRGLGTSEYGILSIALMILGYFSIFDLGLSRATVKFVAENLSPERVHRVPELVWTSLSLLITVGCVGGAIAAAFVPISVTHFFKMPPSVVGEARTALLILCASMPVMLANDALRGVLEGTQRFDLVNLVKVPSSVLFYLTAALMIPFGAHVATIVTLLVLIRFCSGCVYLSLCFRVLPGLKRRVRISRQSMRPLAVFGGWVMVTNIMNPIYGYLERFLIASVLSVSMLTFYSVPYELVSKLIIFPMSIVPSLFPYFSYHAGKEESEVSDVTSRTMKYLLLILVPLIAVFLFFARDILLYWVGPQFAERSTVALKVTAVVIFLNAFAMVPYTSVQALGRPELKAIQDLILLPLYVGTSWWLMRHLGITGAALGRLFLAIVDTTCLYIFAARLRAFSVRDCFSGPLARAITASGALLGGVWGVTSLHARLPLSILFVLVCFVCYLGLFWIVAVDEDDRITLGGVRERLLSLIRGKPTGPAVSAIPTE